MRCSTRGQRGSVLMLMPAAVVIMLLLGALAVDSAIVYLEQRQAYNVAFDAANDAAGAGLDLEAARTDGTLVYDPARVEALAAATVAAAGATGLRLVEAVPDGDGVAVTVEVRVQRLFGQAFGGRSSETLQLTARAAGEVRRP
jgi:Flp pilus assembly protein TadG